MTHKRPDVSRSQLLNLQEEHDIELFARRCTAAAQTIQQKRKQSEVLCWSSDAEKLPYSLFSSLVWTQGHASTSHPGHTRTMQLRVLCSAPVMCWWQMRQSSDVLGSEAVYVLWGLEASPKFRFIACRPCKLHTFFFRRQRRVLGAHRAKLSRGISMRYQ